MAVTTCFRHHDRPTGRSCTRCDRPACSECLREAAVGSHCFECIAAARPPVRERVRRWNATSGAFITKGLVALNLSVFVLTAATGGALGRGGDLQASLALSGPTVAAGEWWRLVTSGFVHYGLLHVAFNMLVLYRFGEMLEAFLGRLRMLGLYLASLLAGSLGAVLISPMALTAGASGAVFGLVAAAAIGLRQRGVDVWQSGVGPLIAVNLVLTFAVPGISIGGHVGGLVGGAVVGAAMLRSPLDRRSVAQGVAIAVVVAVACAAGAVVAAGTS
ncbi:MAG: rhomboid family intramembrane serine protease [Actinobacteria bacterium]|nr:rhomboid family intramembrane serine protease [Actinomycetota bacterium]MBW3649152.1 rhomboid family intramembrane serine protease [Actinomycetota bacterium]